jgi:hypothetical protein
MDFNQIEQRFETLRRQHSAGRLDDQAFRFEVAKLMLRDEGGTFWMIEAQSGAWFRNRGEGWEPGDPHAEPPVVPVADRGRLGQTRRARRLLLAGTTVVALLAVIALWMVNQGILARPIALVPTATTGLQVTIASPTDGSEVTVGQEVAVESMVSSPSGLESVAQIQLLANDQTVDLQQVQARIQDQQTSLPLSQPWRPAAPGEYQLTVRALSGEGQAQGTASITVRAIEAPAEAVPERVCTPDASFSGDVTIAPGTVFPPGARMDKVWQVRNSGSCAWGVGYELVLVDGENLGAPSRVPIPPTAAGASADLAVTFRAPTTPGTYANLWQMQAPDGQFFGPRLDLSIQVEAQAVEDSPPQAPTGLAANVTPNGEAVRLTWLDQADNEDAYRIYREDVNASIGLAPADAEVFIDQDVTCGRTYRYSIVAFNAAGSSSSEQPVEVIFPPCVPTDAPPNLTLTIVPTQVVASQPFTITFVAEDDVGMDLVIVWGEEAWEPELSMGRIFTCTTAVCSGNWPLTVPLTYTLVPSPTTGDEMTQTITTSATLTVLALARDSSGQESDLVQQIIDLLRPEQPIQP